MRGGISRGSRASHLDEAETLHRISSPEAANRDQQIQIGSNPIRHGRRRTDLLQFLVAELAQMDGLPASFDGVVWHRRTLDQGVQEPLAPLTGEPVEARCETTSCREAVSRSVPSTGIIRCGAVACQRECRRIGTVEGHREFPEGGERRLARRFDDRPFDLPARPAQAIPRQPRRLPGHDGVGLGTRIPGRRTHASLEAPIDVERRLRSCVLGKQRRHPPRSWACRPLARTADCRGSWHRRPSRRPAVP